MLVAAKVSPVATDMRLLLSSCYTSFSPHFVVSSDKKVKAKTICAAEHDQSTGDNLESSDK